MAVIQAKVSLLCLEYYICPHRRQPCTDCRLELVRRWPCLFDQLTVMLPTALRDQVAA